MTDPDKAAKKRRAFFVRAVIVIILLLFAAVVILGSVYSAEINRLHFVLTLYDESVIVDNFRDMDKAFPRGDVRASGTPSEFARADGDLPETFTYEGEEYSVKQFLGRTWTTGLVVIKDDTIRYEEYYRGNTEDSLCISWSVAKSFLSALIGIAIDEGHIDSVDDQLTKYAPELAGSGYDGVTLKQALQMSAGIYFNEDYGDFNSDINKLGRILAIGGSLDEFVASMTREREPGTYNKYTSTDTQAVAMALVRATGTPLPQLLEEKIWKPVGMESDAFYLLDTEYVALALGGLNATLRDYARFGSIYLHEGQWNGKQIVPKEWVKESTTPDAPHLMPGDNPMSTERMGYAYQWWIPVEPDGEFLAVGIYNQFIYIYPKKNIVIAKTSAYADYTNDPASEYQTVEMFRAIAKHYDVSAAP